MNTAIRHIAMSNPQAARRMRLRLQEAVFPVAEHPCLYRQSERVPGCREIVAHPNYVVVYQVGRDAIDVLRALHSRQ